MSDNYTNWLFDLEADPREEHNLIDLYPDVSNTKKNGKGKTEMKTKICRLSRNDTDVET